MKKIALISLVLTSLSSLSSHAAILPKPKQFDHRMTEVDYNPYDVINVRAGIGTVTVIQLESGESVIQREKGLMLGDAQAWGFDLVENNIFFKPIAQNPDSNLILTTDKGRTYTFYLMMDDYPHYMVKLNYPMPTKKQGMEDTPVPCTDGAVNFQYEKWGDMELSPSRMWDDGRFTCLKFTNVVELPVIYQVMADGSESMIQYHMRKDTMVVHGTSREFRLRVGDQVLGIVTDALEVSPFNEKKSTIGAKRVVNNE
ncbi:TrbG/VirB9 family P-type conjugative transfer protein [Vibrio vulnificus]|uniref:TrbG/VirB9 family P-type conjugative transfer protein n=1 Tax=Vibrio vulnificus TaxID=672 RepID=UPI004058EC83